MIKYDNNKQLRKIYIKEFKMKDKTEKRVSLIEENIKSSDENTNGEELVPIKESQDNVETLKNQQIAKNLLKEKK